MNKQEPPNAVQIELTEGCNLACSFCGIAGIRDNKAKGPEGKHGKNSSPFKFMSLALADELATQIAEAGWTSRIEFAMHGEPTMNPDATEIIKVFRKHLPKNSIMMTSNGGGLMRGGNSYHNMKNLFSAGLNALVLDDYEHADFVKKIYGAIPSIHTKEDFDVYFYPMERKGNPHQRRKPTEHALILCGDIVEASKGNHSLLNNHCGNAFPPSDVAVEKRCAKPFREMSIRWDGNVALCCNDWRGYYKCGSVLDHLIHKIWNNALFRAARRKLYHKQRDFGPCKGCDATSYRVGLLPDKMGKIELPKPTKATNAAVQRALVGDPYTKPVLRPWEK